jgi:hypothetical protein
MSKQLNNKPMTKKAELIAKFDKLIEVCFPAAVPCVTAIKEALKKARKMINKKLNQTIKQ